MTISAIIEAAKKSDYKLLKQALMPTYIDEWIDGKFCWTAAAQLASENNQGWFKKVDFSEHLTSKNLPCCDMIWA